MRINKIQNSYRVKNNSTYVKCSIQRNVHFEGQNSSGSIAVFLKELFRKRKEKIILKTFDDKPVEAKLLKPRPFDWYIECKKNFLGLIWTSISNAELQGNALPDYYKNKDYLFINSLNSTKELKGIGTQLVKAVVRESQKLGLSGRVSLNTSTVNKKVGTPVPFYYKLGFKSVDSQIQAKIEKSMLDHKPIPADCEATTMYLPKEKIAEILSELNDAS